MEIIYKDFEQTICEQVIQVVAASKKTANLVEDKDEKARVVGLCKEIVDNFKTFNVYMHNNGNNGFFFHFLKFFFFFFR